MEEEIERVDKAYIDFTKELFGYVPDNIQECTVDRDTYTEAMKKASKKHGLEQGDPDYLRWILTLVGRSPRIVDNYDEFEAEGEDDYERTEPGARNNVGKITPSTTNGR